jgi:23S rRNA (uracil1939-C5)-methyltransferase
VNGAGIPGRGSRLVVDIEAMDDEGRGRGLLSPDDEDERVDVAVRGGLVGDRVEAQVQRVFATRRLVHGRVTALRRAGDMRTERVCEHPEPCVGCPLGAMEYGAQLALKRARVEEALAQAGVGVEPDDVVPASSPWGYRQKVKLVAGGRAGALTLGLYAPYSHLVIDAARCASHRPELRDAAEQLRRALHRAEVPPIQEERWGIKAAVLRAFTEGVGAVLLTAAPLEDREWGELAALVDDGALAGIAERVDPEGGNSLLGGAIERTAGAQTLTPLDGGPPASVDAFCQPDPEGATRLYELVADWLESAYDGPVLDVYAGTGGFSRALLQRGEREIVAIERAPTSADALPALGVRALTTEVAHALPELAKGPTPSAIVADPPRKGLFTDGEALAALRAPRFVLVSCDPDSFARDLNALREQGYSVDRVVPIDLFPGTPEIEIATLLTRPGG